MLIRCPGCDGALNLPKPVQAGVKMVCPRCGQKFRFKCQPKSKPAPARNEFDEIDDFADLDDDLSGAFPAQPLTGSRPRRGGNARRSARGKSNRWWLPLAVVGGGFAVISLVVIATVLLFRDHAQPQKNEDKVAGPAKPAAPVNNAVAGTNGAPQNAVLPAPEAKPDPPIELPPVKSPPKVQAGDGQLSADVLKRVKKATVLLRVTKSDGSGASGTGFFAVDKQIVITNAHVVGMLQPGTVSPRKIEIVVDSGEPNERTFLGRVMALDRTSDLAVLKQVRTAAILRGKSPTMEREPLKVFSAKDLLETQVVYVFGYPFGEELGKNITVSRSSVSSLRKDKQGLLKQVQVNGGMHPGNSGGPVVDGSGNVIGVAVAGIPGTQVNFAIPGDSLYRMLEGRVSGISLGDARQEGKEFLLPVVVNAIDPLRRLKSVQVCWWVGNPGQRRGPSSSVPKSLPGDSPRQTVSLTYRPAFARGMLRVPAVPEGKTLYIQPGYQTADGSTHWVTSIDYDPGPLLDLTPAMLTLQARNGQSDVYLNSKSRMQFQIFGGEELSLLSHIDATLLENTWNSARRGACDKQFTVKRMQWGVSIDNKPAPRTLTAQQAMQHLGQLSLIVAEDEQGNLRTRSVRLGRVPTSAQRILGGLGNQMLESLDLAAVPINGIRAKPGTNWTASRLVPIDTPGSYCSGAINMNYTYKGLANHFRRRVAVIAMRGMIPSRSVRGVTVAGKARGTAYYALSEHRVIVAEISLDVGLMMKIKSDTAKANGQIRIKLSRLPPERLGKSPGGK